MKIAVLSPVAWRTPPRHYGPWEQMASNVAEGMVERGHEVSLFATGDSLTAAKLYSVCASGYEEDRSQDAKVLECLHISSLMERSHEFDIIHNHFDFLPLTYSRLISTPMVTTIHGFSSSKILPVYQKYNAGTHYVSISNSDRSPLLDYAATVYNGLDAGGFDLQESKEDYLLFFGRLHPDKGPLDAIEIARKAGKKLLIAGIIQDQNYFKEIIEPHFGDQVVYLGHAGPEVRNRLLGGALALLHPIHFEEPFGLSVVESMLCGTPVIAYHRGSMPELITEGENGFLVHHADEAAARVSDLNGLNPESIRRIAQSRFSKETMVAAYEEVYMNILTLI